MTHKSAPRLPRSSPVATPAAAQPRTIESTELLGAQGVLHIRHQNVVYRLQTTRFGKLILTK